MLIAQQKLKENIAEYILYMYQIEDVVRAYQFNLEDIIEHYVRPHLPSESFLNTYRTWYTNIIQEMTRRGLEKSGHLAELNDIMVELSYLHNTLLNMTKDEKYIALFDRALPFLNEFKEKSNLKDKNEVELAFHALYMKLLLKIQKKEISAESEEAFDAMRIQLAYLAKAYLQMKNGTFNFVNN
jgi:hypothetical protein